MSQAIDLNQTIGILPPEARGCDTSTRTVVESVAHGNSSIFDPSMEKSRCFQKEQIYYQNVASAGGNQKMYPYLQDINPMPGSPVTGNPVATDSIAKAVRLSPARYAQWLPKGEQEKNFFWICVGALILTILLKSKN